MGSGGNFRVLVVDDDELAVAAISSVLAEAGCMVTNLATPIGVTQVVLSHDIDVVIVDLQMPALPGDRLAAMLRGNKRLQDIPVIIVSAAPEEELRSITQRLPGVVALPKRRVRRDLVKVVRELAVRRRGADLITSPMGDCFGESIVPPPVNIVPDAGKPPYVIALRPAAEGPALGAELRRSMPRRVVEMTRTWREASCGSLRAYRSLLRELHEVRGECELFELEALSDLATALDEMVKALRPGAQAPTAVSGAVLAGFNLLARLSRAPDQAKDKEILAVMSRLSEERKRLLEATPLVDTQPDAEASGAA